MRRSRSDSGKPAASLRSAIDGDIAPAEARERTIVSTTAIPEGLPPHEIDTFVSRAMAAGEDLYHLDAGALSALDADLVVTQDLCAVCAVDVSVVDDALDYL